MWLHTLQLPEHVGFELEDRLLLLNFDCGYRVLAVRWDGHIPHAIYLTCTTTASLSLQTAARWLAPHCFQGAVDPPRPSSSTFEADRCTYLLACSSSTNGSETTQSALHRTRAWAHGSSVYQPAAAGERCWFEWLASLGALWAGPRTEGSLPDLCVHLEPIVDQHVPVQDGRHVRGPPSKTTRASKWTDTPDAVS